MPFTPVLGLTRDNIASAALELVDDDGLSRFSMGWAVETRQALLRNREVVPLVAAVDQAEVRREVPDAEFTAGLDSVLVGLAA